MPGARIIHYGGGSSREIVTTMKRMELANRQRFVDKHYPPAARALYKAKAGASLAFWHLMGRLRGQPVQVR
ncbi:hypothetical protein D3C87_2044670 [compost metagenome]